MKNAFGLEIYGPREILEDLDVFVYVRDTLVSVMQVLGMNKFLASAVSDECLAIARRENNTFEYERKTHEILEKLDLIGEIPKKLSDRARVIFSQIRPYVLEGRILDNGCGDGKVGEELAKDHLDVVLADVYKNPNVGNLGLEFRFFEQGQDIPARCDEFDNTLAITVLHHSDNPFKVIKEMQRVTRKDGRVIVIESVYGVNGNSLKDVEKERHFSYTRLGEEQQRKAGIVLDHFFNRAFVYSPDPKNKVNVPFNFNTPEGWKEIFEENGFEQIVLKHLGIDHPVVPEYHTLHVFRAKK